MQAHLSHSRSTAEDRGDRAVEAQSRGRRGTPGDDLLEGSGSEVAELRPGQLGLVYHLRQLNKTTYKIAQPCFQDSICNNNNSTDVRTDTVREIVEI